ncbi:SMI1/KNR4 family protein [Pseudomonas fragariae (ex Marin et al. 2024)]|uniref:SMI1/KNR4 family protein n=2 Tax=Pseudomonas fragariae (ex Marin et al. 2024) TaxID=3080056 RepID=A0ABU5BAI6_9PSED|nr:MULTISPECIES: SMI1/KNR4 family protein [unclassified Pseudomonas]MCW6057960.1 SMI1/KNR4 family protein [Pseudomonas fragi]MDV0428047.1 SMI1/KNR4 family protein [Pseudomonas sp. 17]MDX9574908.1 SMI1/KNR4 family protein [Pseudomonas sp. 21(2023)]MDX9588588.1 SMI1/KNR4 family protein [Pseudomonas sp. 19(2023)]MDX9625513.1 SMI1/KNR4 family protein [Pseudomonas sp. 20]
MIPNELIQLIEKQPGNVHRTDKRSVIEALAALDINLDSELSEFFLNYTITFFKSNSSNEELCDIAEPSNEIEVGTNFIHEVWDLPKNFICLTSVQGEGCYLYDKNSGQVLDFSLASRDDFLAGKQQLKWDCFFEFLTWYLS